MNAINCFDVWVGRRDELERLGEAVRKRQSLLIWGQCDSGKTALVSRFLASLTKERAGRCLCISMDGRVHDILREHVSRLYDARDPFVRGKFAAESTTSRSFSTWVKKQTSVRLRGLLYRAANETPYWLFWDDSPVLGWAHTRILKELIGVRRTPVYLIAQGMKEKDIGEGWHHYWHNGLRLGVGSLRTSEAKELLDECIRCRGLSRFARTSFREQILELSGLLPGAIVKMTAMAAQSRYQFGDQIKTKLIYVDYLAQQIGSRATKPATRVH
jgi:hypothetical protein